MHVVVAPPTNVAPFQVGAAGNANGIPGSATIASESTAGVGDPPAANGPFGAFQYRLRRIDTVPTGALPAVNGCVVPGLAHRLLTST